MRIDKIPLVSITILCYNHEKYIAKAIESCLNQTYENLEIIIVDNASTDGSHKIIEPYLQNEKVKFFKLEENRFPSAGTNFAIKKTKGEYIALLSGDDSFLSDKIEVQLEHMIKSGISNSFTWVNATNDKGEDLAGHEVEKIFNQNYSNDALKERFIAKGNVLCALTFMAHKDVFEKYGYFDHRLLQLQDFDFWLRILRHEPINILPQKLTNYCIRNDENNLSLGREREVTLRSTFEYTHIMRHILNLDLETLSRISGSDCTDENKYKNLFTYYKKRGKFSHANGVLFELYETLGSSFEYPSQTYKDFFEIYSKHEIFKESYLQKFKDLSRSLGIKGYIKKILKKEYK